MSSVISQVSNMSQVSPASQALTPSSGVSEHYRLSFGHLVHSEFYKLSTLKSSWWVLAINAFLFPAGAAIMVAILRFASSVASNSGDAEVSGTFQSIPQAFVWVGITLFISIQVILIAIFGILSFTGERSANTIQGTYAADPKRSGIYFGKAIAVFVMSFSSSLIGALIAWGVEELMLVGITTTPLSSDSAVQVPLSAIVGSAFAIGFIGVFGLAIGGLVQSSLGSIFTVLGITYLLPEIFQIVAMLKPEWTWAATTLRILPSTAVQNFTSAGGGLTSMFVSVDSATGSHTDMQTADSALNALSGTTGWVPQWWASGLIVLAWTVIFLVIGWVIVKRRDIK